MKIKLFAIYTAMSLFAIRGFAQGNDSMNLQFSDKIRGVTAQTNNQSYKIIIGSRFIIDVARDDKEHQFPFAYKFGRDIFVPFSEHKDAVMANPVDALIISRNNGKTWKKKIEHSNFYMTSMFKKNGKLYGIVYFTYPISPDQERMIYWTSKNQGKTWVEHQGIVNALQGKQFKSNGTHGIWGSMLFHQGMQVMEDGSIQGPMYGLFEGDKKYTVAWVKSTDDCATWNIISIIASGTPKDFLKAQGYCEPTFAKVKDGSLLCVMRIGSYLPLFQSRSKDGGLTWSKPVEIPGLSQTESQSVDPHLLLMKNGTLVLSYGRPDTRIAISMDGSGYRWDTSLVTYNGVTTGYTGLIEIRRGKLLQVADQGANWSKGVKQKAIWGRIISIKTKQAEASP